MAAVDTWEKTRDTLQDAYRDAGWPGQLMHKRRARRDARLREAVAAATGRSPRAGRSCAASSFRSRTTGGPRAGSHQGSSCRQPSGRARAAPRSRHAGRSGSSRSSRAICALNGSSFDPVDARRYAGGASLWIARLTCSRCRPVRRLISRIDKPRTKCSRRISAHCSTSTTPVLPGSLCADEPRVQKTTGRSDEHRAPTSGLSPWASSTQERRRAPAALWHHWCCECSSFWPRSQQLESL